jgi:hypothetical protein
MSELPPLGIVDFRLGYRSKADINALHMGILGALFQRVKFPP